MILHPCQLQRVLCSTLLLAAAGWPQAPARAADVVSFSVTKGILFRQTNAAAPILREGLPYVFQALVIPAAAQPVNARVQWSMVDLPLSTIITPPGLGFIQRLASQDTLDATFPNSEYRVVMQSPADGTHTGLVSVTGNTYPSPPMVLNFLNAQTIEPGAPFVLQWGAFAGGTAADLIFVQLENSQGRAFATGFAPGNPGSLDGTATSVMIPANTLQAGRAYAGRIAFFKFGSVDGTNYPGVTGNGGYFTQTDFYLRTTGAGDVTPPVLATTTPAMNATNVPINAPVVFRFSEPMSRGFALGISGTSANRTFEWSPDSTSLVATPVTNWPANTTIVWTLNLFYTQLAFGDANGNPLPMETILSFTTGTQEDPAEAPRLIDPRMLPNGRFQFRVTGESNRTYSVQATTNTVDWTSLSTNLSFTGAFDFLDTNAPAIPHRLYRAVGR